MNNKGSFLDRFKKAIWILTPFILLTIVIILLLEHCQSEECLDCNELQNKINVIEEKIKEKDCLDCEYDSLIITEDTVNAAEEN